MKVILAHTRFDPVSERNKGYGLVVFASSPFSTVVFPLTAGARSALQDENFWERVQLHPEVKFFLNAGVEDCLEMLKRIIPGMDVSDLTASEIPADQKIKPLCFSCRPSCNSCYTAE